MTWTGYIAAKQLRRLPVIVNQNIEVTVIVEISDSCASTDSGRVEIRAQRARNIFELSAIPITEHQLRLGVTDFAVDLMDIVQDVSIRDEDICETVTVEVQKLGSKSTVNPSVVA